MNALGKIQKAIAAKSKPLYKQRKALIRGNLIMRWGIVLISMIIFGIGYILIFKFNAHDNGFPVSIFMGVFIGCICLFFTQNDRVDKKDDEIQDMRKSVLSPIIEKVLRYYLKNINIPEEQREGVVQEALAKFSKETHISRYFNNSSLIDVRWAFTFGPIEINIATGTYFLNGIKIKSDDNNYYGEDFIPIEILCSYRENGVIEGKEIKTSCKDQTIPINIVPYLQEG